MKKSIFIFFAFTLLISLISSCYTPRKGGCDCPGSSQRSIGELNVDC